MKLNPKLIIFDLDGTLVEFPHSYLLSETERILPLLEHPEVPRGVLEECFADFDFFRFVEGQETFTFIERFWAMFDWEQHPGPIAFEGTRAVLEELTARGVQLGIATARKSTVHEVQTAITAIGLADYFSCIASREEGENDWQNKQRQILDICGILGVPPEETVMVGDIPADIVSAKAAGIGLTVAVLSGGIREHILRKAEPDIILNDLSALVDALFPPAVNPS